MSRLVTKSFSKPLKSPVHNSRKLHNRGVSEIIGAMLLLAITVAGGTMIFFIVQDNDILDFVAGEEQTLSPIVIPKLILSGYDTRDAVNLYGGISVLDNLNGTANPEGAPNSLCTSCTTKNEFIILKVRNDADTIVDISGITVNEIDHVFDTGNPAGATLTNATLPEQGEFIIISGSGTVNVKQEPRSTLPEASEKRIVIRLSSDITPDIPLNSKMRIIINSSVESTQLLLVPAGRLA